MDGGWTVGGQWVGGVLYIDGPPKADCKLHACVDCPGTV